MYEEYLTNALVGIINAKQALRNYHETNIKALKNTAAYNIQQALEYMIKSYCDPLGIEIPKTIKNNARTYTSWESESRYRLGFSVRITSLEKAIQEAEKWLITIKPKYQKKISQVNKRLML